MMSRVETLVLLEEASLLLSEDGENTEYDRAIGELVTTVLGLRTESKGVVLAFLRAMK